MGMKTAGALSSLVMADKIFLIPVPDKWTLQDAATVPVVYGTVLYALVYVSISLPICENLLRHHLIAASGH